ncbi:hypothetical protein JQ633_18925 [Bradyrhizobium tropiciagri]|uniref:hypothetical protein n=1 Tax=Bradyrhizobium tropiciagri TaxID=312253 RepID=UPI001BA64EAD|nr:hypothetical protein [Bradyrhizobium tropiciagri]MBR0872442.1 hypothetical protein [Bradyrhizobium tropiciagri]
MRIIAAAFMMALITGPALAQDHIQQYREEDKPKTEAQKAEDRRAERAYQRSLSNVPDQKQTDPWGMARPDNASQAAPKPHAKPAAKMAAPKPAAPAGTATK